MQVGLRTAEWSMKPFERLDAWQACHEVVLAVYRTTKKFPKDEQYGLTAQLRRASISITANIAEGSAKRGKKEFRRYLDIALGSLAELRCLLRSAKDLGYMTDDDWVTMVPLEERGGLLLWRLYRSMGP
jgi:four helix bundle protein